MIEEQWLAGSRRSRTRSSARARSRAPLPARECRAASKDECLEAHGRGQDLRDAGTPDERAADVPRVRAELVPGDHRTGRLRAVPAKNLAIDSCRQ